MSNDEFYIGWQGKAPKEISKHVVRAIVMLGAVCVAVALLLGFNQKKFGSGNFEFGKLTEVTGVFSRTPVLSLKVAGSNDIFKNQPSITIPLIGFGKFGADGVIQELEKNQGASLEGMQVTLKGTLLYNDGKLLMQIDGNDKPLVKAQKPEPVQNLSSLETDLGELSLKGEIVDPKCYFGVMKPGQGKPHKDCAIRCILGGIPPTLRVVDNEGRANYYLVVGPNGEALNSAVQEYVAEPVSITAKAVRMNDWIVLYTKPTAIEGISRRDLFMDDKSAITCVAINHQ